jgi:hypothetical protein
MEARKRAYDPAIHRFELKRWLSMDATELGLARVLQYEAPQVG